jgi:SAM-dependent methyltransferase
VFTPPQAPLQLRPTSVPSDPRAHEQALRNRSFFDSYWSEGRHLRDRLWRDWWGDGYAQALAWAGPLAGKRVLQLFTGLGEDAAMLTACGADVCGVDFSLPGLRHAARERAGPRRPGLVCADATRLPLANGSVDVVLAVNGLCHTPKAAVLAECRRVLKPDGKLLLIEVMRYPHLAMLARFCEPYKWRAPHRFLSVGELEDLAKDFSFARHREFFVLSVLSAMLLRLPLGRRVFLPLHHMLVRADRHLLRWFPSLRRIGYLCVAELRP